MKIRDRFLIQTVVCFMLFASVRGFSLVGGESFGKLKDEARRYMEKNYSLAEVKEAGIALAEKVSGAPAALAGAVLTANVTDRYGQPIDQKETEGIKAVHAVAMGTVSYAGIDKELGLCIKIEHDDKTSVYGNLRSVGAVTGEKVKKGDIIGTFDGGNKKDFYYELRDLQ